MCLAATQEAVNGEELGHRLSRRKFLAAGAATAVATVLPACGPGTEEPTGETATPATATPTGPRAQAPGNLQDLTHPFRRGFPVYTGDAPERETLVTIENDGFYAQQWVFAEHSGTHVDVPGHFAAGGRLADAMVPEELVVPAVVVDISDRAADDPDAAVEVQDLEDFEGDNGEIPSGGLVIMRSGWAERADDPEAFRNPDADGTFHFPGFGAEAVEWLLENRQIAGIGVDTLSLDPGNSTTFDVHHTLLGADRYGVEDLTNLDTIPPTGATVFVGLVPWEEGSGGPARVIARW